jgi:hypothetical protein
MTHGARQQRPAAAEHAVAAQSASTSTSATRPPSPRSGPDTTAITRYRGVHVIWWWTCNRWRG